MLEFFYWIYRNSFVEFIEERKKYYFPIIWFSFTAAVHALDEYNRQRGMVQATLLKAPQLKKKEQVKEIICRFSAIYEILVSVATISPRGWNAGEETWRKRITSERRGVLSR